MIKYYLLTFYYFLADLFFFNSNVDSPYYIVLYILVNINKILDTLYYAAVLLVLSIVSADYYSF